MRAFVAIALTLLFLLNWGSEARPTERTKNLAQPQVKTYEGQGISFTYPYDWHVEESNGQLTVAPMGARRKLPNGRDWITTGMYVGAFPKNGRLKDATDSLFAALKRTNPNMSQLGFPSRFRVDGHDAILTNYANFDASADWTREQGNLLTVDTAGRIWYWLLFCSSSESSRCEDLFKAIISSIRIKVLSHPIPVVQAVYVEPSKTLIRQTIQIAAGNIATYNLTLPAGSTLVAQFQVEGGLNNEIGILLMDMLNHQKFMAGQQFLVFQGTSGTVKRSASYTFRIPQSGMYYLVLDNRKAWMLPRNVTLYTYALLRTPSPETVALQRKLNDAYVGLRDLFVFTDFRISVQHCGMKNAFSDPNITLCVELAESLGDQGLETAMGFVLFHELGHSLMRLWGQPLWDNEDAADEFATVFMMMGNQESTALQAAQWWASETSEQEALRKLWIDDRHTISPQRARNIVRWLGQKPELLSRWSRVFIPNMQTQALESALIDSGNLFDRNLVQAELSRRRFTPN